MSTKTKARKDVAPDTELVIGICKVMSTLIGQLPAEDQSDMIELLQEMSRPSTQEEMAAAEETIREIFKPLSGTVMPMLLFARTEKVQKWADFSGARIRECRKESGLTQAELAEKAGLPQSHISRIENDEISPNRMTLEKLAEALGVPFSYFDPSA